jgi:hypothetical protein
MTRQITSLFVLAGLAIYFSAWALIDDARLMGRALYLHAPKRAAELMANGQLLEALFKMEILAWWPFLMAGMAAGLVVNIAAKKWAGTKQIGDGSVTDRFGVRMKMINGSFDHRPAFKLLQVTPRHLLPTLTEFELSHASDLELEILGAIYASQAPADVTDAHGTSLYLHTLDAWRGSYHSEEGAIASLEAVAAVLHDAGKVMTFVRSKHSGAWIKTTSDHESRTSEFLRRLPSYILLPQEERTVINTLAAALAAVRTDGYPPEIAEAVARIKMFDSKVTGAEKRRTGEKLKDGEVDFSDLFRGVQRALRDPELFVKLNINRRANSAEAIKAFFDAELKHLVIQAQSFRALIAPHVSEHNRASLSLRQPTQGFHPSYAYIATAIEQMHALVSVHGLMKTESGMWSLRSGNTQWPHAYIIDATTVDYNTASWGKSSSEFAVTPLSK